MLPNQIRRLLNKLLFLFFTCKTNTPTKIFYISLLSLTLDLSFSVSSLALDLSFFVPSISFCRFDGDVGGSGETNCGGTVVVGGGGGGEVVEYFVGDGVDTGGDIWTQVPECIGKLAQAGLKIWLLTGDKKETAINIGFACSLLRDDMIQFHISLIKEAESLNQEKARKEEIMLQIQTAYQLTYEESKNDAPFALVVDGKALELALRSDVKDQFLHLAVHCASVICCCVSAKQKALITRLVKEYTGWTTLAIGDGANDVGMIQEADIGVGISGMEGMQAVMASDFSLPQFRFLGRLLVVHGHWCYKRISKMIIYFVYKNMTLGLTLFYYELYSSFSGEVIYDDWYMVLFNVVLTSLPVIALGVFEQDVSSDVCLQV